MFPAPLLLPSPCQDLTERIEQGASMTEEQQALLSQLAAQKEQLEKERNDLQTYRLPPLPPTSMSAMIRLLTIFRLLRGCPAGPTISQST